MKRKKVTKLFSAFLALAMVLSLVAPFSVSANVEPENVLPFKSENRNEGIMEQKAAIAEQLNVLDGGSKLHKDLQGLTGNEQIAVIVHLSEKPVALEQGMKELKGKKLTATEKTAIKSKVKKQQTSVKKEAQIKNIKINEKFSYDTVLNGFSATVKAEDLEKMLDLTGVTLIEPDTEVHAFEETVTPVSGTVDASMDTSISFLGIEKLWDEGIEGQGVKVAVLDTGIDKHHPDFAGIYKGGKNFIPHSSTYAKTRASDDASETLPSERPAATPEFNANGSSFYTSHGTHVAGTIAAIGANPYNVKGIAPKVDLYAYRVLGAYGSGSTSGIVAAIEEAVIQEMDVINLSLGGGANSETDSGSFAINNAMMAGTISVIATGNSGPNRGTMGTPATARLGIAVGNTTNPEAHFDSNVTVTVGDYKLSKTMNLMGTTFGADLTTQLAGEYDVVAVPGMGTKANYAGLDVKGKVVLVSRGEIAFVDKIAVAKEEGAIAVLIHNFTGGSNAPLASGTFLGDAFEFIPTYDVSQTDGEAIRAALTNGQGTVTFSGFNKTMTTGDDVNASSSRGPSTPNFDIKPDVSAPGTNIMSTIPMYKEDDPAANYDQAFSRKTGTSMATPHIAGIAALVKQANPTWNAFDVKVALSNTAKILDTTKYDVMAQGAGRVDAYAAANPSALAYAIDTAVLDNSNAVVENKKGTVTFGPQSVKDGNISVTKQILVKDVKGSGGAYNVAVDVTKSFADAQVTVDKSSFTLNGEQLLTVTLTASQQANAVAGSELLGYIKITGGDTEISLPFAADFGGVAAVQFKDFEISETDLSFDGDGVQDEAMLYFTVTGDLGTNFLEIWDIMDPDGGEYGDGYIGYLHAGASLAAGSYQLGVKGKYTPWTSGAASTTIPDGLYTFDFSGQTVSGTPPTVGDYVGPVIVKTTKPEITGSVTKELVTGQVTDKYLDYNTELAKYGLNYEINTKLKASYVLTQNGVAGAPVAFKLAADGSYSFPAPAFNAATDSLKVVIKDAAGNSGEKMLDGVPSDVVTVAVNKENLALEIGATEQLTVTETTTKPDGTKEDKDVTLDATFTSADEKVVTVENGIVTAIGAGKTDITVSYKEFTSTVAVEVAAKTGEEVVTYTVSNTNLTLGVGQQEQLFVTEKTTKADGTVVEKDVTGAASYNVVNNKIATIQKGLITALTPGKTQARVMISGQETIFVYLEVTEAPQDQVTYSVSKKNLTLGVGQSEQFYVTQTTTKPDGTVIEKDVTGSNTYNAVNNKIATVKKGLVTALKEGKTQVRVTIPNEEAIYVYVEVVKLPQNIITYKVNKTNLKMQVGDQVQLKVTETTLTPEGKSSSKDVTATTKFNVVNNTIAKVQTGLVTAHAVGKTQVRVMITGQDPTLVYLNVTEAPKDQITYAVNKDSVALKVGATEQLTVTETTTKPDGAVTEKNVTADSKFVPENNNVVTLNNGLVTAVGPGETVITVTHPNFTANVTAVVEQEMIITTDLKVSPEALALKVGEEGRLAVQWLASTNGDVVTTDVTEIASYNGFDTSVIDVQQGKISAVGVGETEITVSYNDKQAIVSVKTEAAAVPQTQKHVVTDEEIASQVNDKKAKEILITVTPSEQESTIEFSAAILQTIVKSGKDLHIQKGEASYKFSKKAVEKLVKEAGGDVTITLKTADASSIADAVSENFTLGLEGVSGDNRFALTKFNEKIEINLPIDGSKVKKTNKLSVLNLNSNVNLKVKYKNNTLEFEAQGAGSFVVVNE